MKDVELKLISELLKNSRRSDRELANAIGVSQPTVSRTLAKLKREGFIINYTVLPDFGKLGYSMLAITFIKLKKTYSEEEAEKIRTAGRDKIQHSQFGIVMLERGIELGYDGCIISIYRDYSEYAQHKEAIRTFPFVDLSKMETFTIDLRDKTRFHPLSFDNIARQLADRT